MKDSKELTELTKSQYSDTIECFVLKGMGFVGIFKSKKTVAKVSREWMSALKGRTRKIKKEFNDNDKFVGYKLTVLI